MNARWIALLGLGAVLAQAAEPGAVRGFSLSQEQVRQVIAKEFAERGIDANSARIVLPVKVIASLPNPVLEIRSIDSLPDLSGDGERRSRSAVRMICCQHGTCLPFYVIVTWPAEMDASELHPSARADSAMNFRPEVIMRTGAHAVLVMDDGHVHIRIAVSLANGAAGSSIRVATADHKQVYVGQVVSADLLRGSF